MILLWLDHLRTCGTAGCGCIESSSVLSSAICGGRRRSKTIYFDLHREIWILRWEKKLLRNEKKRWTILWCSAGDASICIHKHGEKSPPGACWYCCGDAGCCPAALNQWGVSENRETPQKQWLIIHPCPEWKWALTKNGSSIFSWRNFWVFSMRYPPIFPSQDDQSPGTLGWHRY